MLIYKRMLEHVPQMLHLIDDISNEKILLRDQEQHRGGVDSGIVCRR